MTCPPAPRANKAHSSTFIKHHFIAVSPACNWDMVQFIRILSVEYLDGRFMKLIYSKYCFEQMTVT